MRKTFHLKNIFLAFAFLFVCVVVVVRRQGKYFNTLPRQGKYFNTLPSPTGNDTVILILLYTRYFGDDWFLFRSFDWYQSNTPNCLVTYSKKHISQSHIVLFHSRDMPTSSELQEFRRRKPKQQLWMYVTLESVEGNPVFEPISEYFDLMSTYRLDSDVRVPYRYHLPISNPPLHQSEIDYSEGKTKQVAWVLSNCNPVHRIQLAKTLIEHGVDLQVSGACAHLFPKTFSNSCPRNRPCAKDMVHFKFYFAAENGFCEDYITEKYWENPLYNNLVPIVLGGSNYSNPMLAIPGSFIDAMSFKTPKALAEYIIKVDSDDNLYNSYFKWKRYWKLDADNYHNRLCSAVRNGMQARKTKPVFNTGHCVFMKEKFEKWIKM